MGSGWIKLHRKLLLKGYYTQSQYVHLWVHLLLLAQHKESEYMTNGRIIVIKKGQLITGRKQISNDTGIPESTVERILNMLENEHQIEQQKTTKYRLITIVNWEEHQKADNTSDSKRTASGHMQELKNVKKDTANAFFEEKPITIEDDNEDKPQSKEAPGTLAAYRSMVKWAEDRRGFPFLKASLRKQYAALKMAKESGIKSTPLKERWIEIESQPFYEKNGFDWMNVVTSFNKKQ